MRRLGVFVLETGARPGPWRVPPHVTTALRTLRPVLDQLVIGVRGPVAAEDEAALSEFTESLHVGGPTLSPRELLQSVGEPLTGFDEVLLWSSDWIGPLAPVGPLLERMAGVAAWSLVPRGVGPHMDERFHVALDPSWCVLSGSLAHDFARRGHLPDEDVRFAFPPESYPSPDPVIMNLPLLIADGLPFVPLRAFGVDPLVADRLAVIPRDGLDALASTGVDMADVWRALLDRIPLRVLSTNLGLTRVLSGAGTRAATSLRTVAILHLYYEDLTDELMDRVDMLPGAVDVVITTTDEPRRAAIEARLTARTVQHHHEVRVIESNQGRDISAFLVGCADVLADDSYDLVVKLHGKRSAQDDVNASSWFRRHLFDNLLPSGEAATELYAWFDDQQLGVVVPPVIHMYYPTMGHAWLLNRDPAEKIARQLGLTVPFDEHTPVAAYGSMFIARRECLVPWLSLGLTWADFPEDGAYGDGTLAHAVERLFCYVAAGTGRYTATALGAPVGGLEYGFLEYKLQAVGARLTAYAVDQVPYLDKHGLTVRARVVNSFPRVASALRPLFHLARRARARLSGTGTR